MSVYINAVVMLLATIAAFLVLAKSLEALRAGRLSLRWRSEGRSQLPAALSRLAIEQTCVVDGKRRLLLVRCDDLHILLMTGGPTDLVVAVAPRVQAAGAVA